MDEVRNVAVVEVFEGEQVGSDGAGVLKRACLFPAEGLARRESEGKGEFGLGDVEWNPFGLGFGFLGRDWWGFGVEGLRCFWLGAGGGGGDGVRWW